MLKASGWGEVEGSKVHREFRITPGRIEAGTSGACEKARQSKSQGDEG